MNSKQEQGKMREEYREMQTKYWHGNKRMIDYCVNKAARFVRLASGHLLVIDKPRIETRFCFGYSDSRFDTEDYDRANEMAYHARTNEDYFKGENLKQLREVVDTLQGKGRFGHNVAYIWYGDGGQTALHFCRRWELIEKGLEELGEQDRQTIIAAYEIEIAAFEKRLNTYLKRYGMSKVHTWSYWQDA